MDKTCNLRLLEPSDLEFLERIENDTRLWKYSNTTKPFSNEVLKIYIQNAKQDIVDAGQQRLVTVESDSNKLGLIDLFDYEPKHARAAVGVVIVEECRGKGYAKEASQMVIDFCFKKLGLRKISLGVIEDNVAAVQLYDKLGFIQEGLLLKHGSYDGKYCNSVQMSIFNPEFKY